MPDKDNLVKEKFGAGQSAQRFAVLWLAGAGSNKKLTCMCRRWTWVGCASAAVAQRSPLGWAMGSSQRLAAVAAASHARHYNRTHTDVLPTEPHYNVNLLFVSATLCGVLVAVCAACWRRTSASAKPEDVSEVSGVYTVSADSRLNQIVEPPHGPPPAYDTVVECPVVPKDCPLQEVTTDPCSRCQPRCDSGLPSYEAAVMLKDTKL